jgi:hypothetical protein
MVKMIKRDVLDVRNYEVLSEVDEYCFLEFVESVKLQSDWQAIIRWIMSRSEKSSLWKCLAWFAVDIALAFDFMGCDVPDVAGFTTDLTFVFRWRFDNGGVREVEVVNSFMADLMSFENGVLHRSALSYLE